MTEVEAAECLLMLKGYYPRANRDLDERTAAATETLWLRELQALHIAPAREAIQEHARTNTWYPSLAELRTQYDLASRQKVQPVERKALPPPGRKEQQAASIAAPYAVLECEHGALAQAGKLTSAHPCFTKCIKRQEYEALYPAAAVWAR